MNSAVKAHLQQRHNRWVAIQAAGVFVGRLVGLYEDGVVIEAMNGRMFAITAGAITMAGDPDNEAALEEAAEQIRAARIQAQH